MKPSNMIKHPVLRYHGGNNKLREFIFSLFPDPKSFEQYVEPFAGGASVLLSFPLGSHLKVYNDLDKEVVNFFKVLRSRGKELKEQLVLTPYSREEFKLSYEPCEDELEQARRTFVRSWLGHSAAKFAKRGSNGLRYANSKVSGNPVKVFQDVCKSLDVYTNVLMDTFIECSPALDVIKRFDGAKTLFYVDPPYLHSTRSARVDKRNGYKFEMTDEDHIELLKVLQGVKGMVVLAGYDSSLYDEYLNGWSKFEKKTTANSHKDSTRTEIRWCNPACINNHQHKRQLRLW